MCGFGVNGQSYLTSYRDPNIGKTLDVYKNISGAKSLLNKLSKETNRSRNELINILLDYAIDNSKVK